MRTVAAAVVLEQGRLLLARRPTTDRLAGLWELPGGKVESGEDARECLLRELAEELSMAAHVGRLLVKTTYTYEHGAFEILAFETRRESEYVPLFHDRIDWVTRSDLVDYGLAPADVDLVAQLIRSGYWV